MRPTGPPALAVFLTLPSCVLGTVIILDAHELRFTRTKGEAPSITSNLNSQSSLLMEEVLAQNWRLAAVGVCVCDHSASPASECAAICTWSISAAEMSLYLPKMAERLSSI